MIPSSATLASAIAVLSGAALLPSCGDDSCGPGTVSVDGTCVPGPDACGPDSVFDPESGVCRGTQCARGTVLIDGECVPDGSVICGDGTRYDPDTGACVTDISGCGPGTVLIGDLCVPEEDAQIGAIEEFIEPNDELDGAVPLGFLFEGEPVTLGGCITPYADRDADGELDPDIDAFVLSVTGPTLVRITVDGKAGLAGAFRTRGIGDRLAADGWQRLGVSLVSDTSARDLFFPEAGGYVIEIGDARALLSGVAFGGPDTCYYASLTRIPVPPAVPLADTAAGGLDAPRFYRYSPDQDGALVTSHLAAPSPAAAAAVTHLVDNRYQGSTDFAGYGAPAEQTTGALSSSHFLVVVDPIIDLSLAPVEFTVDVSETTTVPLENGSQTTIPLGAGQTGLAWFSGQAGDVISWNLDAVGQVAYHLTNARGDTLGAPCSPPGCSASSEFIQLAEAGVHFLAIDSGGGSARVTVDWTAEQPVNITVGQSVDTTLSADGNDWYQIDIPSQSWLVASGETTNFSGSLIAGLYPRRVAGIIDGTLVAEYQAIADATTGRIFATDDGQPRRYLVRARDSAFNPNGPAPSYGLAMAPREHTPLSVLTDGQISLTDLFTQADGRRYFFIDAPPRQRVTLAVTELAGVGGNSPDLTISLLDITEAPVWTVDDGAPGADENTRVFVPDDGWFALAVDETAGVAGTFDLNIAAPSRDFAVSGSGGLAIPALDSVQATASLVSACIIEEVTVDISVQAMAGDLRITLTSPEPDARVVTLHDHSGGATAGPTGNYPIDLEPVSPLDDLAGATAQGEWQLLVDNSGGATGELAAWSLNLYCQ